MSGRPKPKYKAGDYLTIYCGLNEGCCFIVCGVRWANDDRWQPARWEYYTGMYGWRAENTICTEAYARLVP